MPHLDDQDITAQLQRYAQYLDEVRSRATDPRPLTIDVRHETRVGVRRYVLPAAFGVLLVLLIGIGLLASRGPHPAEEVELVDAAAVGSTQQIVVLRGSTLETIDVSTHATQTVVLPFPPEQGSLRPVAQPGEGALIVLDEPAPAVYHLQVEPTLALTRIGSGDAFTTTTADDGTINVWLFGSRDPGTGPLASVAVATLDGQIVQPPVAPPSELQLPVHGVVDSSVILRGVANVLLWNPQTGSVKDLPSPTESSVIGSARNTVVWAWQDTLYVVDASTGVQRPISYPVGGLAQVATGAVSPDAQSLGIVGAPDSPDPTLSIVDLLSGATEYQTPVQGGLPVNISWTGDSRYLIYGRTDSNGRSHLYSYDTAAMESTEVLNSALPIDAFALLDGSS